MNLKEIVLDGHIVPGYYLNKKGELYSTRLSNLNRYTINTKERVCYGAPMQKRTGTPSGKYILYRLSKLFTHRENDYNCKNIFGVQSHRALMETYKPLEQNLPEDLVDVWDSLPEIAKKYIKHSMQVDHIDPDSSKTTFHHLDNLQWLSIVENCKKGNSSSLEIIR